ncbi:SWI SNF complex component SNF12-like protein [Micractinium conductrix]|uniref:SWI SNF complex component SNF12-like protein n=1 Tax=Micractinium conductrix TaxID=554055 RepID=A0A2P6V190_9CHLO|nr:SWI SNF complex component SNF12-like protein [Micractinium conductrix]|eukprot:PSC67860.1 SWI SNF complex component SNF12-like protein [Micractinium conductrix]
MFQSGGMPQARPGSAPTPQQQQQQQMAQLMAQQQFLAANPHLAAANPGLQAQLQLAQARAMAAAQAPAAAAAAGRLGAPTNSKPPIGGMKGAATGVAAAATAAVRSAEAVPAKKGCPTRKRRAADLRLPDRGDLLIPDSPLFAQLQDAERRVDMLISRKRHELQEMFASFRRGPPGSAQAAGSARRKLRVYIRSEHFDQGGAGSAEEPPSWQLAVSGRLLGKADKGADKGGLDEESGHHHKHHFTHYVKRIEVTLDPAQYPGEQGRVVWDKARHEREHREAITVRRLGSAAVEASIKIELDYQPAQWRLSPQLNAALGLKGLHSLPYVMQMLWGYIKAKQLYEPSDRGSVAVRCDDRLRELFGGAASVELGRMSDALKPHLSLPEPVTLMYTIKPDGPAAPLPDCYDFEVEVPLSTELPPYALKAGCTREVEQLDAALTNTLSRLAEHRRRHTCLLSFAQSPVDFCRALVAAQGRELRMAATKEGEAYELMPSGDVYKERWVEDAVLNYMQQRQQAAETQAAATRAAQQQALAEQQAAQQALQMQAAAVQQQAQMQALAVQQAAAQQGQPQALTVQQAQAQAAAQAAAQMQAARAAAAAAAAAGGAAPGGGPS